MMVQSGVTPLTATRSQRLDEGRLQIAGNALIDARRIHEPVAEDDCAVQQRRPDDLFDMIVARGGKKDRFHAHAEDSCAAPERSTWRTASAPGEPPGSRVVRHRAAAVPQGIGKQANLGGFPGPLAAFECNEQSFSD